MLINTLEAGEKFLHELPCVRFDLRKTGPDEHGWVHLTSVCEQRQIRLIAVLNTHFKEEAKRQKLGFTVIALARQKGTVFNISSECLPPTDLTHST